MAQSGSGRPSGKARQSYPRTWPLLGVALLMASDAHARESKSVQSSFGVSATVVRSLTFDYEVDTRGNAIVRAGNPGEATVVTIPAPSARAPDGALVFHATSGSEKIFVVIQY